MTDQAVSGEPEYVPDPRRWRALWVCLVAGFMTLLDLSIVNVALPSMQQGAGATDEQLQWVVAGYALAFGLLLVPAGRLGDVRGRRTVFVIGVVAFTVSSTACGLAPNAEWLVAGRFAQGLAGGLIQPQVSGFLQELFRGAERGKAFGILGASIGLATALGPLAGGLLIGLFGTEHGWRAVFFVNVPVGIAATVLGLRILPRGAARRTQAHLDPLGVLLLGAAVVLVLLPLVEVRTTTGPPLGVMLPLAAVALLAFVLWERAYSARGREPLVDLSLYRRRSYGLGAALGAVYFAGFVGIFFVVSIYLQDGLGYSALHAGLLSSPFAIGSGISAVVAGRLVTRVGRPLVLGGLVVVVGGLLVTALVADRVDGAAAGWAIAIPLFVTGLGSGCVISPNLTLTLAEVPLNRAGSAGAVVQIGQRIGSALGVAAVGAVLFGLAADGDWGRATAAAMLLSAAGCSLALLLALADVTTSRRRRATSPPEHAAEAAVHHA